MATSAVVHAVSGEKDPHRPVDPDVRRRAREYMARPYLRVVSGDPVEGYLARVVELPGCMTTGDTPEEAMAMLTDAMDLWLIVAIEEGATIPEPPSDSGRFNVRLPKSVHQRLVERAEAQGVSLNAYVATVLAQAVAL